MLDILLLLALSLGAAVSFHVHAMSARMAQTAAFLDHALNVLRHEIRHAMHQLARDGEVPLLESTSWHYDPPSCRYRITLNTQELHYTFTVHQEQFQSFGNVPWNRIDSFIRDYWTATRMEFIGDLRRAAEARRAYHSQLQMLRQSEPTEPMMVMAPGDTLAIAVGQRFDDYYRNLQNFFPVPSPSHGAANRAWKLLRENLTSKQLTEFEKGGTFTVIGSNSGSTFKITQSYAGGVLQLRNGKVWKRWCFLPYGQLQMGDVMLAQKTALENVENEALAVANLLDIFDENEQPLTGMERSAALLGNHVRRLSERVANAVI